MAKYEPKYWNHKGNFQKRHNELYDLLVLPVGDSPTVIGQMLRYASKIYYDIYNNGGCNLDMDYFITAGLFLMERYPAMRDIAREMGIKDFSTKLEMFYTNDNDDQANDEVIDVIVTYVDRQYAENDLHKLIHSAELAASLLTGSAPEIAADLRKLIERTKNVEQIQVPTM